MAFEGLSEKLQGAFKDLSGQGVVSEKDFEDAMRVVKMALLEAEQEAILQMELLGHTFFLFKNSETNEINVVYRRNDGAYGLLIPIE